MKANLLLLLSFIGLCAYVPAKKKKKVKSKTTTTAKTTVAVPVTDTIVYTDSAYWYKVSFISLAAGIDQSALKSTEDFIKSFETKNKVRVIYKVAHWGREGELDYCFALNKLTTAQAKLFKESLQQKLIHSTRIRYKDNCKCDRYREVTPD